ncbi:hypothetical protein GEMRC1_001149 [Eukaryota sp. GEM-RC1]
MVTLRKLVIPNIPANYFHLYEELQNYEAIQIGCPRRRIVKRIDRFLKDFPHEHPIKNLTLYHHVFNIDVAVPRRIIKRLNELNFEKIVLNIKMWEMSFGEMLALNLLRDVKNLKQVNVTFGGRSTINVDRKETVLHIEKITHELRVFYQIQPLLLRKLSWKM